MRIRGNEYNRTELAGAFGDLGTFIPFVAAYITLNKMDPLGILLSFGIFKIFVGLHFKTPFPVQPMKAIGGMAIAHPETITQGMIWGSGIFTGVFWLVLGLSGAVSWLHKITAKPIVRGIMLGLGLGFMLDGLGMMKAQPFMAVAACALTFFLLSFEKVPAMLILLAFGIGTEVIFNPTLSVELSRISVSLRIPEIHLNRIGWQDFLAGALILGLPQAPLTLGNAIIATAEENNELFPDRPVKVKTIALNHGLMNLLSASIGGIPLCHGAGGMAGHVRFGARTGGALVILGVIVLLLGLFFSDSISTILKVFPPSILGVILFFTGLELASIARDIGNQKSDVYVMLVTAGLAMWNMGVAYFAGLILYYAIKKKILKV
ncbi:MAG: putative sulfate/molybdate transporter [Thermodesulfobacteriota bacterium]|nr:putative sulfate/molybdate transporter [Thermodesulfobacteriota bacterium]